MGKACAIVADPTNTGESTVLKIRTTKPDTQKMTPPLRSVTGLGQRRNFPRPSPVILSPSSRWPRTLVSHTGNVGSNPTGDAMLNGLLQQLPNVQYRLEGRPSSC